MDCAKPVINLTDGFLELLFSMRDKGFSEKTVLQAKQCFLDYLGVALAGAAMRGPENQKLLDSFGPACGFTVIGTGAKTDAFGAVLLNGMNAHAAELDDGHRFGMLHLGSPVLSAMFTAAERESIRGYELITGIIIGYEAAARLACAAQPAHRNKGYHTTGTCGTIGAAMGVAAALGYSRQQAKAALSCAVSSAAGVLEIQEEGSALKPYNAGRAALDGYVSAMMGSVGFRGPDDILGGKRGFLAVMADGAGRAFLEKPADAAPEIERVYRKLYASCRHSHPAVEAALAIAATHNLRPADIDAVRVFTYRAAVTGHDHQAVHGTHSAKMSTPFSVAVALATGKAGVEEFSRAYVENESVNSLARKVKVLADDELTALAPQKRAAKVEIETKAGVFRHRVDTPKGEPENPLSPAELEEKFTHLALFGAKTEKETDEIIQKVWNLESELPGLYELL